jgi:glycosyltransferase involved in cell wall biosynthesis
VFYYSVIIPHKNIPKLLQRCLDSIPQREDIQIIIIDDNSDPGIVDFEHFPGLNRSNVEVPLYKGWKRGWICKKYRTKQGKR